MGCHSQLRIAGTVNVGPKGQVVIPSEVREQMGIAPGDKLIALSVEGKKSISFITESDAQSLVDEMGARFTYYKQSLTKEKRNT